MNNSPAWDYMYFCKNYKILFFQVKIERKNTLAIFCTTIGLWSGMLIEKSLILQVFSSEYVWLNL